MKVSQRTEYGLRAMVAIAAAAGTDHPVPLRAIAEAEGIPEQFLDQIVAQLRRAGFVKSVRGVNGGYMLSRPAADISVGDLVRVLEGSLAPIGCIREEVAAEEFCGRIRKCHTRNVWLRVMQAVTRALDSISLADVMMDEVAVQEVGGS
ncbi:AsnC family transcriptional regulator [Alicyclobacillus cellulosilyticus]|uniref:AsnC family transcriptional regulator n=1 Tax=Alicyclobacillus cellulosilyticus TaxID=1003997 RepID=A0A917NG54_9BACL|nr:Rrf2 family transcriptional regulator [Alicyclobacillus cellulosilyticus]GGI98795.1 AsnC family transcriptional regulator [Alicyclobacillus cellulosilyticus]